MSKLKSIKSPHEHYVISDDGVIINNRTGTALKHSVNNSGYCSVSLCNNGKNRKESIHRLVYETYIGDIPEGCVINHKDSNRKNNEISNLEVMTYSENIKHGYYSKNGKGKSGQLARTPKVSGGNNSNAKAVRNLTTGEVFDSISIAELAYGKGMNKNFSSQMKTTGRIFGCDWEYIKELK